MAHRVGPSRVPQLRHHDAARQMDAAVAEATVAAKQALADRARPPLPSTPPPHPSLDARGWDRRFCL